MRRILFLVAVFASSLCFSEGKVVNPVSDVCWNCLFPITVSGVNVTPNYKDQEKNKKKFCFCSGVPPKAGIPLSFWEPSMLIDVTRHPYKLMGLGGISIGKESVRNRGSIGISSGGPSQSSFYHVHVYEWPMMAWLGIFKDFSCVSKGDLGVTYLSELDPTWNDEELNFILNTEAALFANPAAQLACVADCAASNMKKSQDALFWCAGCSGSLYPLTGTVAHHQGGIQASALLVNRVLAKLHHALALKLNDANDFCEQKYFPIIKKSQYKTQLTYPFVQKRGDCPALGASSILWGSGKSFPGKGEDFVYVIWTKKKCCLDAAKASSGASLF